MKKLSSYLILIMYLAISNLAMASGLSNQGQSTVNSIYLWLYGFGIPVAIVYMLFIFGRIKLGHADWGEFWKGLIVVACCGAIPVIVPALWNLAKSGFAGA